MSINSVPYVECFCNYKNVLCIQSMVQHFVRHPVCTNIIWFCEETQFNILVLSVRYELIILCCLDDVHD